LTHIAHGDQNYPGIYKKKTFSDKAVPGAAIFTSQVDRDDDNGGRTWFAEGSTATNPMPMLRHSSNVDLIVSDGADLAIEDTTKEPKVFFATSDRVKEANTVLSSKASPVSLRTTDHYLRISNSQGATKKLFQVEPKVGKTTGTDVKTPQRCNEMADFVMKFKGGAEFKAMTQGWDLLARTLDKRNVPVTPRPNDSALTTPTKDNWLDELDETKNFSFRDRKGQAMIQRLLSLMSEKFQNQLANNANEMEAVLADLNLNGYMMPKVGSVIVTYAQATDAQEVGRTPDTFLYHFGSVVATSGSDYITMENYARRDAAVGTATASAGDPLFFFKMYGPEQSGETWHDKALATNAFLGATISFVVE
jgi:hypothetical protein